MKNFFTCILLTTLSLSAIAQNVILNGSFENNSATNNLSNLTGTWPVYVSDSWEVDGGTMDLITSDNCGTASDGNWFVRTSPQGGLWPYMAFSLKLSPPLFVGTTYYLNFDKMYCGPNSSPIDIGISSDSTMMGTIIHTFDAPLINSWQTESYGFIAPDSVKYLTVNIGASGSTGQVAVDNFVLESEVGINLTKQETSTVFPNPFSGSITIENILPGSEIEIDNLCGACAYKMKTTSFNEVIDLASLHSGVYILRINEGTKQRIIKLVKE